jgi:hypothetical protein
LANSIRRLQMLRNQVVHGDYALLSIADAVAYRDSADEVINALRSASSGHEDMS